MRNFRPSVSAAFTVGALTVALTIWTSMAERSFCWQAALGALVLWSLLGGFGICLCALWLPKGQSIEPVAATVLGFYCVAVILFLGTAVLHLDLLISFAACLVLLGALAYRTRSSQPLRRLEQGPASAIALLIAVLFTTLWSRQNLAGLTVTATTVTSMPWYDTFHHSVFINHFAHGTSKTLGTDPLLSSAPLPPYHYAADFIPSLLVRCTGISAYLGTVAIFAPLGTLLTGMAAYGFGRRLHGPLAGVVAVVFCLALPDATFYLLENRWLSYFFFQQIAANGSMGTALMLVAWTYCIAGQREQLRRYTAVGLVAALLVVFFKSQVFLAYSFGILLYSALTLARLSLPARLGLGASAVGAFWLCAFELLPAIPRAPTLLLSTSGGPTNLHWSLSKIGGACQQCITELAKDPTLFLPVGMLAFLVLVFGILVPLALVLASSGKIRRALGSGAMWFLWVALSNYLVVTLGLQVNLGNGDPYEVIHKTFIWPHLALAVWCGCAVAALLSTFDEPVRQTAVVLGISLSIAALGGKVFDGANRLQTAFVYPGSEAATQVTLSRAAYDAARYIRTHSDREAVIQLSVLEVHLMFQSLAERHAYVGYPAQAADVTAAATRANQRLSALLSAPDAQAFQELARRHHIDYFVLYPGQQPAWAASLTPEFQSGEYRVYRL